MKSLRCSWQAPSHLPTLLLLLCLEDFGGDLVSVRAAFGVCNTNVNNAFTTYAPETSDPIEAAAPLAAPVSLAVAVLVALQLLSQLPPHLPRQKTGADAGAPVPPFLCPHGLPSFTIGLCEHTED